MNSTETKFKNVRSKSKNSSKGFLRCFKPVALENQNSDITYAKGSYDDSDFFDKTATTTEDAASVSSFSSSSMGSDAGKRHRKIDCLRRFSRVLRTALFQMSLRKSKLKRNLREKTKVFGSSSKKKPTRHSNIKLSSSVNNFLGQNGWSEDSEQRISASTAASTSGRNNAAKRKEYAHNLKSSLCVFLLSLVVLILCGKVFAILCTSSYLLFVPRWDISSILPKNVLNMNSKEEKKKASLEGLLERNGSRASLRSNATW